MNKNLLDNSLESDIVNYFLHEDKKVSRKEFKNSNIYNKNEKYMNKLGVFTDILKGIDIFLYNEETLFNKVESKFNILEEKTEYVKNEDLLKLLKENNFSDKTINAISTWKVNKAYINNVLINSEAINNVLEITNNKSVLHHKKTFK